MYLSDKEDSRTEDNVRLEVIDDEGVVSVVVTGSFADVLGSCRPLWGSSNSLLLDSIVVKCV